MIFFKIKLNCRKIMIEINKFIISSKVVKKAKLFIKHYIRIYKSTTLINIK